MPQTPHDERERSSVPKSRAGEDDDEVYVCSHLAAAVSSERYVEVIPEPRRERDMPSSPEFLNGAGDVGVVEVFEEVKAEHMSHTYRHI